MFRGRLFSYLSFVCFISFSNFSGADIIFKHSFEKPQIIHQWKFSETGGAGTVLVDSVGSAHASIVNVGANNASVANGRVTLSGGDKDSSDYVSLPDDILNGLSDTTIELWAANISILNWSRIFDFGPSTSNLIMMSWTRFTNANEDRIEWANGFNQDNTMAPYGLSTERHIVMTINSNANQGGNTLVKWYLDGVYKGQATTGYKLSNIGQSNNWLGRSKYPDPTANAWYNEVRIYDGALSDSEVSTSFATGPSSSAKFDAATFYPGNDKYYLFSQNEYYRHKHVGYLDTGYPLSIPSSWDGWDAQWGNGQLDAISYYPSSSKYYLFKGNQYIQHAHGNAPDSGYPKNILGNWSGWPAQWGSGDLDAAVYYPGNSKFYIFKGNEYVRHSFAQAADATYPRTILSSWSGWPAQWGSGGLDAIVYYEANSKYYLFKGDEYVKHSHGAAPDSGYPRLIEGNWAIERKLTATNLIGDINALSNSYSIQSWSNMNYPDSFNDRGDESHIQGIAKVDNTYILTHSREVFRGVVIFGSGSSWTFNATAPDLGNHPGGIQASGDIVIIPYKTGTSGIKFFQFTDDSYDELVHLRITNSHGEAAGLAYHPVHDRYYVIDGANASSGFSANHDMYRSKNPGVALTDSDHEWEYLGKIYAYGSEGAMQLIYDENNAALHLVALSRPEGDNPAYTNTHRMDISTINVNSMTSTYLGSRDNFNQTNDLFADPTFRFGAGLILDPDDGEVSFIATERCVPSESGASPLPCIPFQSDVDYLILKK